MYTERGKKNDTSYPFLLEISFTLYSTQLQMNEKTERCALFIKFIEINLMIKIPKSQRL